MTNAQIIDFCRKHKALIVIEHYGWKIVPKGWVYPQGFWSQTLKKAFEIAYGK